MNPRRLQELSQSYRDRARTDPGGFDYRGRDVTPGRITFAHPGWLVVGATLALCMIGVYCIGLTSGTRFASAETIAFKQLVFVGIGLVFGAACTLVHYRRLVHANWLIALAVVGLLVFVLLPFIPEEIVRPRKGARRWINVGVTEFQPSELAKIAYVLVTAGYLRYRRNHRRLKGLVGPALIAFVPMALILVEPDLGTALLFMPTLFAMLIAAGAKLKHLISTAALGAVFAGGVIAISLVAAERDDYPLLRPHQVARIQAVVDQIEGDDRFIQERGFQGRQAMMLIGAGGVLGNDHDHAEALVKFSSLPEQHNDMIFAVFANRFGLLGITILIGVYGVWVGGTLLVAGSCKDPFGRLTCVGLGAMVATQMTINMGMTLGVLPITGMTLPFVSAGGSSLVTGFLMVGLICNIAMRRPDYLWRRSFEFDDEVGGS
ncbi:MAG: rod shape-determining protein RodA [Phycisphaerales bacterium]